MKIHLLKKESGIKLTSFCATAVRTRDGWMNYKFPTDNLIKNDIWKSGLVSLDFCYAYGKEAVRAIFLNKSNKEKFAIYYLYDKTKTF